MGIKYNQVYTCIIIMKFKVVKESSIILLGTDHLRGFNE